jgi:hypothetical protein
VQGAVGTPSRTEGGPAQGEGNSTPLPSPVNELVGEGNGIFI